MFYKQIKINVIVQQLVAAPDASRHDNGVNRLADGHSGLRNVRKFCAACTAISFPPSFTTFSEITSSRASLKDFSSAKP
jgi:hypothetical protein